jgi:putative ABC transport system permease protein
MLSVLSLTGIALGVGIVVAVELINSSALSSFSSSIDFLSGKADYSIISDTGRIDEAQFRSIWLNSKVKAASPVIEAIAAATETNREPIRFIGVDPFLDRDFRGFVPASGQEGFDAFVTGDIPPVYLSEKLLQTYSLKPGDVLTLFIAGIDKQVRILGPIPSMSMDFGEYIAVIDISFAQEIFSRKGYIDRIDIISDAPAGELQTALPQGLRITDANSRKSTLRTMLYSFQLNLAAMSLLALFVGVFLIYNFSMFSVLSRREDMSLLLMLGADRRSLLWAFVLESMLFGGLGSALGVGFGYLTARFSMDRVSSTINELYFFVKVSAVDLTPGIILIGIGVGFAATLAGAGLPALEVAITPPALGIKRRTIEDKARNINGVLSGSALFFFILSLVSVWASRFSIFWGFVSAFAMTLAFALITPSILSSFCHYVGVFFRSVLHSLESFLAARTIKASLSRTSIATAALVVALSMTAGVDTMIYSFRTSVDKWLEGSLQGDLYLSPATTKWRHALPDSLIEDLSRNPAVEALERYATYDVYLNEKPIKLRVMDGAALQKHARFSFVQGTSAAWEDFKKGAVFVSESLAYHFGLSVGASINLQTPEGARDFRIAAINRDYSSDQGTVQMDRIIYESLWHDNRVQSAALFLKPGFSPAEIRKSIVEKYPGLDRTIASNAKMREDILAIFDKTFAPTATLKGVSLVVALLGIATALMAILLERSRDMMVMGYLGLTPREIGKMNVYQALIMGFVAFPISLVCGLVLTYIIVFAINYRSFGWSIDVYINYAIFVKIFLLTMAACFIASLYPTYKLIKLSATPLLRDE